MKFYCENKLPNDSFDYLDDILRARGIENPDLYRNVDESALLNGWKLRNMREGVEKLHEILSKDSPHIFIVVDADTDGYTSAAIASGYMKLTNENCQFKFGIHEGKQHGIEDILDQIEPDTDLLFIPDASSSEIDFHKQVNEMGIPIIICDHHLCDVYDNPYAIVINNQMSPEYGNPTLCGAGVTLKMCQCYDEEYFDDNSRSNNFYDLAAVGLVSDMMLLSNEETHYIVQRGLNHIQNAGLKALVKALHFSLKDRAELYPVDVAFFIAPHINALIRVGTQEEKHILFEALLDGNRIVQSLKRGAKPGEIEILGEQAARIMINVKKKQQTLVDKALEVVEAKIHKLGLLDNKILLIPITDEDNIHSSLTGLVAMKCVARYHKPTLLLRECDDGNLKGSARAEANTDMGSFKDYLEHTNLFEYTAGHDFAFGASLPESQYDNFIHLANEQLANVDFHDKGYEVDYLFDGVPDECGTIIEAIDSGKPYWGQGVAEPMLGFTNIVLAAGEVQLMKSNCLKFKKNGVEFVIFKNEEACMELGDDIDKVISLYGKCTVNEWCGRTTPQVVISDYEVQESRPQSQFKSKYVF